MKHDTIKILAMHSKNMAIFKVMLLISMYMMTSVSYAHPRNKSKEDFLRSVDSIRIKLKDLIIESERETKSQFKRDSRLLTISSEISADMKILANRTEKVTQREMASAMKAWISLRDEINIFLEHRPTISDIHIGAQSINKQIPELVTASDELAGLLIEYKSSPVQVYVATRQLMVAQRIALNLRNATSGDSNIAGALDRFGRDMSLFAIITKSMLKGNTKLRIKKINEPMIREKLNEISQLVLPMVQSTASILERSPGFFRALDARDLILVRITGLELKLTKLRKSFITKHRSNLGTVDSLSTRSKRYTNALTKAIKENDELKTVSILREISENSRYIDSATMFFVANTFLKLKDLETASFLFYAAQIRAAADLKLYVPIGKGGNSPGIALGAVKYQLGSVINPTIVKYPQAYANVVKRLDNWIPVYDTDYDPGWEYDGQPRIESAQEDIKLIKDKRLEPMRGISLLLNNKDYFEAFLIVQKQNKALPQDVNETEKNSATEIMKNIEDELGIDGFIARFKK